MAMGPLAQNMSNVNTSVGVMQFMCGTGQGEVQTAMPCPVE